MEIYDIIARAKELATNGHTPGPWVPSKSGYVGSVTGEVIYEGNVAGRNDGDTNLVAFAPDAVAALAQETYEYGVEVIRDGKSSGVDWCHNRQEAEDLSKDKHLFPPSDDFRIVRRRVSPTEVVE